MKQRLRKLIPKSLLLIYHALWSWSGTVRYGFPSRRIVVIGVTGTKGKTTLCAFLYHLLQSAGITTALSSSDSFRYGDICEENKARVTMPGRWFLQGFLSRAVVEGCAVAIIEVTSEGLMQSRQAGIDFDIVVFINLHPEHIEHHGGYEKYREAKGKLFSHLYHGASKVFQGKILKKTIVVNLDDREADYFLSFPAQQKITYGLEIVKGQTTNHLNPEKYQLTDKGTSFKLDGLMFTTKLLGKQNLENTLAVLAVGRAVGLSLEAMRLPVATFVPPAGRFEVVVGRNFRVIIDYAHTPDSIEALYQNLWEVFEPKRLLGLVGACGGLRDKWKRSVIGEVAARYCSYFVISNEDPFDESPLSIMQAIERGVKKYLEEYDFKKDYTLIEDRALAIEHLIARAEPGDLVVLIGKGAEQTIETAAGSVPWNERAVVEAALRANGKLGRSKQSTIYVGVGNSQSQTKITSNKNHKNKSNKKSKGHRG